MRTLFYVILLLIVINSCKKSSSVENDNELPQNDSLTILKNRRTIVKDSLSNIDNYYFYYQGQNLSPTPGVYLGTPNDYWLFKENAVLEFEENQVRFTTYYILFPNNKLITGETIMHDTATVVQLNNRNLILQWSRTSPNGGKYFRKMWFAK